MIWKDQNVCFLPLKTSIVEEEEEEEEERVMLSENEPIFFTLHHLMLIRVFQEMSNIPSLMCRLMLGAVYQTRMI